MRRLQLHQLSLEATQAKAVPRWAADALLTRHERSDASVNEIALRKAADDRGVHAED